MLRIIGAGPEREAEVAVDPYIPLMIRWTWPAQNLWWRISGPRSMLETGFHHETAEMRDVTLLLPGPIARVPGGPPAAAEVVTRGIPCCDPAEWARRSPRGVVKEYADHHVDDADSVRAELGPDHLLVRIGEGGEPAPRELACGRVRFGISAADGLLWICVDGFSADERALLQEHAERSAAPPQSYPPFAVPPDRPWWRRVLPGG
jgi:hypothetical protein